MRVQACSLVAGLLIAALAYSRPTLAVCRTSSLLAGIQVGVLVAVETRAYVFDVKTYRESVQPAFHAATRKGDTRALLALLGRGRELAPESALLGGTRGAPGGHPDASRTAGSESATEEAEWRAYQLGEQERRRWGATKADLDNAIRDLNTYGPKQGESIDDPINEAMVLVEILCVPMDETGSMWVNLTNSGLLRHLSAQSRELEKAFSGGWPHFELDPSAWSWSYWLDKHQVEAMVGHLDAAPRPADHIAQRALARLRHLADVVRSKPDYVLVVAQTM